MSELKPCLCPICGAELKIYGPEDWVPTFYDPDSGGDPYAANCDCGFSFQRNDYDYAEFVAALNCRAQPDHIGDANKMIAQPDNAPLILEAWSEDDGDCLWWVFPIVEPPYCGTPLDCNWPGYHTHFTRIVCPEEPEGGEGQ